jgi:hypothetical protein
LQKGAQWTEWGERFALVLEAFLRGCGFALRDEFFGQYDVYMNLKVPRKNKTKKIRKKNTKKTLVAHLHYYIKLFSEFLTKKN